MTEQLISFETARLAKAKGFDIPVEYCYNNEGFLEKRNLFGIMANWNGLYDRISAPSQSLLRKYLKETYNIDCWAQLFLDEDGETDTTYSYYVFQNMNFKKDKTDFNSFEEALESALIYSIKFLIP